MTRIVYVNGRYVPYGQAAVHVEDRGFQFADSIYEVCEIRGGALVDEARHLARMERSLAELEIPMPASRRAIAHIMRQCIKRNRVRDGLIYMQVTRGEAPRDFPFPEPETEPTFVCLARPIDAAARDKRAADGIKVATLPDTRWDRCDIKTVMLLPACLAKQQASRVGAREAWFVARDKTVTEGASSNAWIVTGETVVTRPLSSDILPGVTRATLIDVLSSLGLTLKERAFTVQEAKEAQEAFVTSASATVMPVVSIDGHQIGDGKPGPITWKLRSTFHQVAKVSAT